MVAALGNDRETACLACLHCALGGGNLVAVSTLSECGTGVAQFHAVPMGPAVAIGVQE